MQQTDSEQYGVGNQFTWCCELHRLAEDDEMHNVNDEQVEEEDGTEGDDEYVQEEDWKQEGSHIRKQFASNSCRERSRDDCTETDRAGHSYHAATYRLPNPDH